MEENDSSGSIDRMFRFFFWFAALFILFYGLGVDHLRGSEERWAEISREMLLTGDVFHPAINGQIYFDKPLLSYWPIVLFATIFNRIDEFIIRLPSALSALVALWCTRRLGAMLFSRRVGAFAGWVMLASLGFISVARIASADMMNLTAVVMAVCWFFYCKDKAKFTHYLVFYVVCFGGALTKGLPALVIPPILIACYAFMEGKLRKYLTVGHLFAFLLAFGLFLSPFVIASNTPIPSGFGYPNENLSGLELVWKENIVRVFRPFDHKDEPFYAYFRHLPRIMAPWVLLLFAAPAAMVGKWKELPLSTRWLLAVNGIIFLMFSMSGSRRWYYIMPIAPFTAILIAEYVSGPTPYRWRDSLFTLHKWFFIVLSIGGVVFLFFFLCVRFLGLCQMSAEYDALPDIVWYGFPIASGLVLAVFATARCRTPISGTPVHRWLPIFLSGAIILGVSVSVVFPEISTLRMEKKFALALRQALGDVPSEDIAFYTSINPKIMFYSQLVPPIRVISSPEELGDYLSYDENPKYLIAEDYQSLLPMLVLNFPGKNFNEPFLIESRRILEKQGNEKLACWKIVSKK